VFSSLNKGVLLGFPKAMAIKSGRFSSMKNPDNTQKGQQHLLVGEILAAVYYLIKIIEVVAHYMP
jgi:hypothetical protein